MVLPAQTQLCSEKELAKELSFAARMKGFPEAGLVLQFHAQADFRGTTLFALLRSQASSADHSP